VYNLRYESTVREFTATIVAPEDSRLHQFPVNAAGPLLVLAQFSHPGAHPSLVAFLGHTLPYWRRDACPFGSHVQLHFRPKCPDVAIKAGESLDKLGSITRISGFDQAPIRRQFGRNSRRG
jgi:hypothetical protein